MKILLLSAECAPFVKTGGLADAVAGLSRAISRLGHDIRVAIPRYRMVDTNLHGLRHTGVRVPADTGGTSREANVWQTTLHGTPVVVYLVDQPDLFDREGIYKHQDKDYSDNLERFSCFCLSVLRALPLLEWQPEVVHSHDWHAALALAQLAVGELSRNAFYASMGSVFTIHNLEYQGIFPREQWSATQLPDSVCASGSLLDDKGRINCLKAGIVHSGLITTVSPTYKDEIQSPSHGCGMDSLLRARTEDVIGILNGIDCDIWNPHTDPHLESRYNIDHFAGKSLCKLALQRTQGLSERHDLLIGMVQRIVEQKGIDIFLEALERIMSLPVQIVLLGVGEPRYQDRLTDMARQFPHRLSVSLIFDEALSHKIQAGSDAFLMPSRFEPCGLNQLYSMRYGTIPIVRRVGGLADTVVDLTQSSLADDTATGFVFEAHTPSALYDALQRAVTAFCDHDIWWRMVQNGMRRNDSWDKPAGRYVGVYRQVLSKLERRVSVSDQGSSGLFNGFRRWIGQRA